LTDGASEEATRGMSRYSDLLPTVLTGATSGGTPISAAYTAFNNAQGSIHHTQWLDPG